MFASKRTKTITTGGGPIVIRALGWRKLERARQAVLDQAQEQVMKLGGPAVLTAMQDAGGEDRIREQAESLGEQRHYNRLHVLRDGVVTIDGDVATAEAVDDLEEDIAEEAFLAILTLSRVQVTPEAAEAAKAVQGND